MLRIEFHNREKEIREIKRILNADPTLITFIYGPINSGKTELINHLVRNLPTEYRVFYVNLRGIFVKSYEEFLDALFEIDEDKKLVNAKEYAKAALTDLGKIVSGIPIPISLFEKMFEKRERSKDAFKYIENFFVEITKKYIPVLIIDELQVIGDLKVDDLLIYKLFNFFVRLTKELHLAHVFAITSDSLFIEKVYSEAMLQGRCRYLLVDDFDKNTTIDFLGRYGFNDKEKEIAWHYCGGKPVGLLELINTENKEEKVKEMLMLRNGEIETRLKIIKELGDEITIESKSYAVSYEKLVSALKKFVNRTEINMNEIDEISKRYLVKKNILFVDSLKKLIKTQSRLDLLAIRELMINDLHSHNRDSE